MHLYTVNDCENKIAAALWEDKCTRQHSTGCWVDLLLNPPGSSNQNTLFFFSGSVPGFLLLPARF